jgi:signal peptidase I
MRFVRDIVAPLVVALAIAALFQVTVASFKVYGSSMLPNVHPGEYIMVSKAAYFFGPPERGEIIVFDSPRNPNSDLIKRIIALPGETIEIKDGTVFVNDTPLAEPYILEPPRYAYPRQKVTAGYYFVLGDNRNNSTDSHKGWTVPRENIIGKAWITYWPPREWRTVEQYSLDSTKQVAEVSKPSLTMKMPCPTE